MLLHIAVPDDWTTTPLADGAIHQLGDTSIHALRIRELPASVDRWMHDAALAGAPDGTIATERARGPLITVDGWTGLWRETVLDGSAGRRIRVVAFYRFLDYGSGAILDIHASWYDAQRDDLMALLQAARPDWGSQELACLSNLCGGAHRRLLTLK